VSPTTATASVSTYRSIALTMIVTFAVSFALLYWKQKSREPPVLAATPVLPRQLQRPQPQAATEQAPRIAPAVAPTPTPALPGEAAAAPALPVLLTVTRQTAGGDDAGDPSVAEAHLVNSSDEDLAVTLITLDPSTQQTSQAQVFLGPGSEGRAGPAEGLRIRAGDQITLRSEGFAELQLTVP
jgi:hypothetical protein